MKKAFALAALAALFLFPAASPAPPAFLLVWRV